MGSNTENKQSHHHILPTRVAVTIGLTLLFMTVVTVWIAKVDLGELNFVIAMAVASFKAILVVLFFMGLKYDRRENAMIFGTSFLFLAIFIVLTAVDLFFRGDVYVKGDLVASAGAQQKSKYSKPWISTPELVAAGKDLFKMQCVSCHGIDGKGDGPAAGALDPKPRNFHDVAGWKNGRKPTMVFKTLKEGLPPSAMASYGTLPADDRWAMTHYVLSLAPAPGKDTPADFAKIGIDPSKDSGGSTEEPSISVDLAMDRIAVPDAPEGAKMAHGHYAMVAQEGSAAAQLYRKQCAECHGLQGEGGIKVANLGVNPIAYVTTNEFKASALSSFEGFSRVVVQGLPGDLMPGSGQLSSNELKELFNFVRSLGR